MLQLQHKEIDALVEDCSATGEQHADVVAFHSLISKD